MNKFIERIKAVEDKEKLLGLILQMFPNAKTVMETNKVFHQLKGL